MSIQLKRSLVSNISDSYLLKDGQIGIAKPSGQNKSSSPFYFKIGDGQTEWVNLPKAAVTPNELNSYVPTSRTINSKTLTSNISLTASDVGARASTWMPTAADVGAAAASHTHSDYVPTSRTINSKALTANITLTASDVGAAASSHTHSSYLSGTVAVSNGGTGLTTLTSGAALVGNGTSAVSLRTITNNTSTSTSISGSTNLVTMNTLRYAINRTASVAAANTSYTTYMARGSIITSSTPSSMTNGTVAFVYS